MLKIISHTPPITLTNCCAGASIFLIIQFKNNKLLKQNGNKIELTPEEKKEIITLQKLYSNCYQGKTIADAIETTLKLYFNEPNNISLKRLIQTNDNKRRIYYHQIGYIPSDTHKPTWHHLISVQDNHTPTYYTLKPTHIQLLTEDDLNKKHIKYFSINSISIKT